MAAILERAKVKGVTLKLAKSKILAAEVKWFGRVFSAAGVSADPDKILHIIQAGRPETIEDAPCCMPQPTMPSTGSTTWRTSPTRR